MKIFKYTINESQDFQFYVESEIMEAFGDDFVYKNIHQPNENTFYMVATEAEHNKFMSILFDQDIKFLYEGNAAVVKDVTTNVLYNIDAFENIPNMNSDENVLLKFFFMYVDKDDVLDKILECGIETLNQFDKQVLQSV